MPCNVRQVVEDVADLVAESAHRKGLELVTFVDPALPERLIGDPGPPPPDPAEPGRQRRQVHRVGRGRDRVRVASGALRGTGREEHGEGRGASDQQTLITTRWSQLATRSVRGLRHRRRHRPGGPAAPLPAVLAGRQLDDPPLRRDRPRPGDLQAARGDDGRRDRLREHARRGEHVLVHRSAGARRRDRPTSLPEHPRRAPRAARRRRTRPIATALERQLASWGIAVEALDSRRRWCPSGSWTRPRTGRRSTCSCWTRRCRRTGTSATSARPADAVEAILAKTAAHRADEARRAAPRRRRSAPLTVALSRPVRQRQLFAALARAVGRARVAEPTPITGRGAPTPARRRRATDRAGLDPDGRGQPGQSGGRTAAAGAARLRGDQWSRPAGRPSRRALGASTPPS